MKRRPQFVEFRDTRWASERPDRVDKGSACLISVGMDTNIGDAMAIEFGFVDIDLDQGQVVVVAPGAERPFDSAADSDHDVGGWPQVVCTSDGDHQRMLRG